MANLTKTQLETLETISGEMRAAEVARHLDIRPSAASARLATLVKKGLVVHEAPHYATTPEGNRVLEAHEAAQRTDVLRESTH